MIDLNLLPANARKQSSLSSLTIDLPAEISLGVGGSIIILIVFLNIFLGGMSAYKGMVLGSSKFSWSKMQADRKAIDDINKESTEIRNKTNSVKQAIKPHQVGWSQRLNIISDSVGKGMWFKQVLFDGKALAIEGYSVSKMQSDMVTVNGFVSTLRKDAFFMSIFSVIDVNNIVKEKRGMSEISKFSVSAKVQ